MKNKKAQINDMMFVIATVTGIALTMLIAGFIFFKIQPSMTNPDIATTESADAFNAFEVAFPMFDYSFMFLIIGLTIGLIVTSLFIPTSPVFIVINIIGFIVLVFLGAIFANLYGSFIEEGDGNMTMGDIAQDNYPITSFFMQYLPYFCAAIVFIMTIVMYAKGDLGV